MHEIDAPNHSNNEFTDGDPGLGYPATVVWSKWLNTVQRELKAVVQAAGISLDDGDDSQVLQAINAFLAAVPMAVYGNPIDPATFDAFSEFDTEGGTIGPTGSGASYEWEALDAVEAGANWIRIAIDGEMRHNSGPAGTGPYDYIVYCGQRKALRMSAFLDSNGAGGDSNAVEVTLLIDANKMTTMSIQKDLAASYAVAIISLIGYGWLKPA